MKTLILLTIILCVPLFRAEIAYGGETFNQRNVTPTYLDTNETDLEDLWNNINSDDDSELYNVSYDLVNQQTKDLYYETKCILRKLYIRKSDGLLAKFYGKTMN